MSEQTNVKELEKVVIRFSGDSGDGMQLAGNLFSNISAAIGNEISTFPDYPAEYVPLKGHWAEYPDFKCISVKGYILREIRPMFWLP